MYSAKQKLPFVDICSKALFYSPSKTSNSPVAAARSIFPLLLLSVALPISLTKILFQERVKSVPISRSVILRLKKSYLNITYFGLIQKVKLANPHGFSVPSLWLRLMKAQNERKKNRGENNKPGIILLLNYHMECRYWELYIPAPLRHQSFKTDFSMYFSIIDAKFGLTNKINYYVSFTL